MMALASAPALAAPEPQPAPIVSMELSGVGVADFVRMVSRVYGANLVGDGTLEGTVSGSLRNVPLMDAVDVVLGGAGYMRKPVGTGVWLVTRQDADAAGAQGHAEPVVRQFPLKYLEPDSALLDVVRGTLGPLGSVALHRAGRTLVVRDLPMGVRRVEALLATLDQRPGQVMIEASIVEVSSSIARELGIDWSGGYSYISGDVFGGLGSVDTSVGVNLPVGGGPAAGLGIGFGAVSDRVSLDMRIAALEQQGRARLVSSPRIMVLDGHVARIADGRDLMVVGPGSSVVMSTSGGQVADSPVYETFAASLSLEIVPRVLEQGTVSLGLDVRRDEFDFGHMVQDYPTRMTRSARTDLLVESGATVAIGGISVESATDAEARVPGLGSLPIIGGLFSASSSSREERELIIFITPSIMR
jgi:type IV pilus assembly protein PilQ